ncbi:related to alpha/beta hydrolase [Ramularia collo-cygni]|uniref:Related to alpha/beta hydrolase n=1 Tax=Ramularia collo-cygni TaxID=112498 RepID=A0A2D3UU10_9PEZI|nr:related to alpha/beta hydrolase [Ramularia collo-cygni]CZT15387.1 related to alpha/beta hydrolase [Ramularia collo-cygni]
MSSIKTVKVPHLGGIEAAYQMPNSYDSSKPTLVLVNSFTTDSYLYQSQFTNKRLTDLYNLLAIELLGHGQTRCKSEHFTYWDTAIMNLQVLDALKITGKIFVLGTSQGGWITVRMALLAPEKIAGILPLGTSMNAETPHTISLGCWDGPALLASNISAWTTLTPTPDFEPTDTYCEFLISSGFGPDCPAPDRDFWTQALKANYRGDAGRKRIRMAAINLAERDGLHSRLMDVRCPVFWLHGTRDAVYSVRNAQEEIKLFGNSYEAKLKVVDGGQHFLSFSHPGEVEEALVEMVEKYGK